jgi:hypothetical protein
LASRFGTDFLGRFIEDIRPPGADPNIDALAREHTRDALANALAPTDDERHFVLEPKVHDRSSKPLRSDVPVVANAASESLTRPLA